MFSWCEVSKDKYGSEASKKDYVHFDLSWILDGTYYSLHILSSWLSIIHIEHHPDPKYQKKRIGQHSCYTKPSIFYLISPLPNYLYWVLVQVVVFVFVTAVMWRNPRRRRKRRKRRRRRIHKTILMILRVLHFQSIKSSTIIIFSISPTASISTYYCTLATLYWFYYFW